MKLDLNKGWNFFFIKYDVVWASWEFHMAVNKNHGLIFSPDKDNNPTLFFRTAGPFTDDEEDRVNALPLPFQSPHDLPELSVGWVDKGPDDHAGNPAWNIAWSYFDRDLQSEPYQVYDIGIRENQPTALAFDMGGKKLGRIFIEYEAPAGTRFDIGFFEDLVNDRPWVLKRPGLFAAVSHTSAESTTRFETFKPYGLRYIHLNVTGHSDDVKIRRIGVISQIYPFELRGSFSSSDPMFDAIWKLGWRTLLVCSEDTYTDTPFRERGLYAGDALPQYAITLAGSGDSGLMKRSLEVFQDIFIHLFQPGKRPFEGVQGLIDDYPLIALECFRWVVQYRGDMAFARKYYESYRNMIKEYRKFDTYEGLIIFPNVFIEWTELPKRNTASTAGNVLMVRSYRNMAWLARRLEMQEDAVLFDTYADMLTSSILTHCWDQAKGAFRDGYMNEQKIDNHYPIQSALAVAFGITNETHHEKLKVFFTETLADVKDVKRSGLFTPYGGYYILGALYELGQADIAEKSIRQFWSPMITRHNDTAWENFSDHADGIGQGTLSHAWSGGPTFYLSTQVLGVPLMFPDFETGEELVIVPQSATLSYAKGAVPRPEGLIHVEWRLVGDNLFVTVESPEGLKWKVKPAGRLADKILFVNGELISQ
jgi:alpha-L-rhamnosidase